MPRHPAVLMLTSALLVAALARHEGPGSPGSPNVLDLALESGYTN